MDREAIFQVIVQHTREVLPNLEQHAFQHTDSLRSMGANSMDRSEILMMTLESLELNTPAVAFAEARSIGELADAIYEKSLGR